MPHKPTEPGDIFDHDHPDPDGGELPMDHSGYELVYGRPDDPEVVADHRRITLASDGIPTGDQVTDLYGYLAMLSNERPEPEIDLETAIVAVRRGLKAVRDRTKAADSTEPQPNDDSGEEPQ